MGLRRHRLIDAPSWWREPLTDREIEALALLLGGLLKQRGALSAQAEGDHPCGAHVKALMHPKRPLKRGPLRGALRCEPAHEVGALIYTIAVGEPARRFVDHPQVLVLMERDGEAIRGWVGELRGELLRERAWLVPAHALSPRALSP